MPPRDFRAMACDVHRLHASRRLGIDPVRPTNAAERRVAVLCAVDADGVVPADWAKRRADRVGKSHVSSLRHPMVMALSEPRAFALADMEFQVVVNVRVAGARDVLRAALNRRAREGIMPGLPWLAERTQLPEWWVRAWLDSAGADERTFPLPPTPREVDAIATKLSDMAERLRRHAALEEIRRLQGEKTTRVRTKPATEEEEDAIVGSPT